jgi:Golgi phosphoprotein 3 (GPP34)
MVVSMLLAEDLLLLLTDDVSGRLIVPAQPADAGLAGANLVELTLLGKVGLSGDGDDGKPGRLAVRDLAPCGDEVLDAALQIVLAHQGGKPATVIRPLSKNLQPVLHQRLVSSGVLRAQEGRLLGLFPVHRWPAQDTSYEAQVRQRVTESLAGQAEPDPRTAALIALAHALSCEHKIVDPRQCGLAKRDLRARAKQIAEGSWAPAAVRQVVSEMTAAVIAATAAATAAAAS